MEVHTFNHSSWEAEAGGLQKVQSLPGLHSEFQAGLDYSVRPCLKKPSQIAQENWKGPKRKRAEVVW